MSWGKEPAMEEIFRAYPHNPPHLFLPNVAYLITARMWRRERMMDTADKKAFFFHALMNQAAAYHWELEAWAILGNHYHLVARSPEEAAGLPAFLGTLHSETAIEFNRLDGTPGRIVWRNYRDTCLSYEGSYLARLHYVHTNPVKHGLVRDPLEYPYCSYRWLMEQGEPGFVRRVLTQPYTGINIEDDF
jgi:putative transposase